MLAKFGAIFTLAYTISWSNSDTKGMFQELLKDAEKVNKKNAEEYYQYSLTYNCTNKLQSIHFPVLLVYGAEDLKFHAYGKLIHTKILNSELKWVPNVKHQIPTKKHNELNDLIKRFVFTSAGTP